MKKLFLTLSLVAVSSFFYKCTQVEYLETPRVEPVFSEQAQEWGNLFAESLTATAKQIRKQEIKLSDRSAVIAVSQNTTWNTFEQKGLVTSDQRISFANARTTREVAEPVSLAQVLESDKLTVAQRDVLELIEDARAESDSYIEFSNRLATINNDIFVNVPEEEQAFLYSVTSMLYFGLEAMNELVKQAILPGNPERGNITLAHLELGIQSAMASEESGGSSWWDDWGKCAAGIVGGAGSGALAGAGVGGAGCTVVLPIIGTVACGVVGGVVGGVSGGLLGAVAGC